ncbi:pentatricopeptide repeat-containing protein At3g12770 [Cryptomeria japonica]|uniref:pentatricopeptide repeat-containing protein At3g12770 n=1 Tax=Cryptomeria japonica TaxID=3369 RepID=UPI0027DA20D2|nr:pentatricopeptide repeat-containing protein At3g12770 [Cryptomeria japonica]
MFDASFLPKCMSVIFLEWRLLQQCLLKLRVRQGFSCYMHHIHTQTSSSGGGKHQCNPTVTVDSMHYLSILNSSTNLNTVKQLHALTLVTRYHRNVFLETKFVSKYAMFGCLESARLIFHKSYKPDVFLYNAMLIGLSRSGKPREIISLYYRMRKSNVQPDNFTFPAVLKACGEIRSLQDGKEIHYHVVKSGFELNLFVGAALIDMYVKCQSVEDARQVFENMPTRDVVLWTSLIVGYVQNGCANEGLQLFHQMRLGGVNPDSLTMASAISACAQLGGLKEGKRLHAFVIRNGFELDLSVGNSLVAMYAKCGSVDVAHQLFDMMPDRNEISWNAMIAGYAQNGHAKEALRIFSQMLEAHNIKPDLVTMVSVLPACSHLGAFQQGTWIHDYVIRSGFELNVSVATALIDMYAKCGSVGHARQVFDKMPKRDVVSWSAMISGYGMHGHGKDALSLFSRMQQTGMKPNDVTFISVLSACSHAGMLDEGWRYFSSMSQDYCIKPRGEHYSCMVDLLGRAGFLDEALDFINKMPLEPHVGVWGALLSACRIYRNIELGEVAARHLIEIDPGHSAYYVLLSNIYSAEGRWHDVAKVRSMMRDRGLKKTPGCSFIEVNAKVHAFLVGDRSHPQSEKIYSMLEVLSGQMAEAGYVPSTNFVLHDVEEEAKEHMLGTHSEKLAIIFGLISTNSGTPVRITKNLRVCGDCHNATRFISKIAKREIIVRDLNRFHHFKDGFCSCNDYW